MPDELTQKPDTYPARFPLKVIGRAEDDLIDHVKAILDQYACSWEPQSLRTNPSKDQRYTAITVMVTVTDKSQMENLYIALKAIPEVLMCL